MLTGWRGDVGVSLADPWGHAVAIALGGPDASPGEGGGRLVVERRGRPRLSGVSEPAAPLQVARAVCDPRWFPVDPEGIHEAWLDRVGGRLIDVAEGLGRETDQGRYEAAYADWVREVDGVEAHLGDRRFLLGTEPAFADLLLFAFAVRIDPVYFALFKANRYLLEDLPNLHGFARDLYERADVHAATDLDAIVTEPWVAHPDLGAHGVVPVGGRPDLHAPHDRDSLAADRSPDVAVEEDPTRARAPGEWVRRRSGHRGWIGDADHPPEKGRYHLFAPYNCPWSHRALLGRAVKGLEGVVGASVVYFRRHPDRGWQFNAAIPGCTGDHVGGRRFVVEYYEEEGSSERSVPVLYDTARGAIVNNESAEILRMLDAGFGDLATRPVPLYPEAHRVEIDRINAHVYQRINNGAYKAGFTRSQAAYERAFHRYFAGLRWVDGLLAGRDFLVGTAHPTEADLRLFPTVFRHDAVYYARFRLNASRIRDYPHLARWLDRMLAWPGVAEASDLDHARNGYFGRSGNGVVPAGPVPLRLSPKDFARNVWLGDAE